MKKTKLIKLLSTSILISINLFFSACSTTSERNVPVEDRSATISSHQDAGKKNNVVTNTEKEPESIQAIIAPEDGLRQESTPAQSTSPVALAFLKDADKYTTAGDSDRAVASLERGLDIEPKNPWLWNRLASQRLQQKMWAKAITLAKKSNTFASGHKQLQKDNWQIIYQARTALGDMEGARKANKMIDRFSTEKT
jgi:tetratricopeptide (TPR) repeat protein